MKTPMQKTISDILFFNGLFELFQTAMDFHLRLKNAPWLALVVERHGDEVSVTHYIEQNGDMLRDPEMVFSLHTLTAAMPRFEGWVPLTTEPGGFGRVCPTTKHAANGKPTGYYPRAMREAYAFAALWARNLRSQGFVRRYPAGEIESLTHPRKLAERLVLLEVPIPIAHETLDCVGGIKAHRYLFPVEVPQQLRKQAYRQAEAALLRDFPHAAHDGYGYGLVGQGWDFVDAPVPECTCFPKEQINHGNE